MRLLNIRGTGFIGEYTLDNFIEVLTSPGFLTALWTTIVYSVTGTALAIGIGLIAALALSARDSRLTRAMKFGLVGIVGLAVNVGVQVALTEGFGIHYLLAAILATQVWQDHLTDVAPAFEALVDAMP